MMHTNRPNLHKYDNEKSRTYWERGIGELGESIELRSLRPIPAYDAMRAVLLKLPSRGELGTDGDLGDVAGAWEDKVLPCPASFNRNSTHIFEKD